MDKRTFKEQLCQKVSIIRLGYMFEVLKACYPGKAQMLGADFFEVKQLKQEKKDSKRRANFAAGRQASSMMSSIDEIEINRGIKNIENNILRGVNDQIDKIKDKIYEMGMEKTKAFRELLRGASGLNTKTGNHGKHDYDGAMDTIEENLQLLENGHTPADGEFVV